VPAVFSLILLFIVVSMIFWIWALVDAVRVADDSLYQTGTKLIWVLIIVLAGWIGAIIYLAVGRPKGSSRARALSPGIGSSPSGSMPPPPPPPVG
jgi:Phospholipase_D-nuclease N-terminal